MLDWNDAWRAWWRHHSLKDYKMLINRWEDALSCWNNNGTMYHWVHGTWFGYMESMNSWTEQITGRDVSRPTKPISREYIHTIMGIQGLSVICSSVHQNLPKGGSKLFSILTMFLYMHATGTSYLPVKLHLIPKVFSYLFFSWIVVLIVYVLIKSTAIRAQIKSFTIRFT